MFNIFLFDIQQSELELKMCIIRNDEIKISTETFFSCLDHLSRIVITKSKDLKILVTTYTSEIFVSCCLTHELLLVDSAVHRNWDSNESCCSPTMITHIQMVSCEWVCILYLVCNMYISLLCLPQFWLYITFLKCSRPTILGFSLPVWYHL